MCDFFAPISSAGRAKRADRPLLQTNETPRTGLSPVRSAVNSGQEKSAVQLFFRDFLSKKSDNFLGKRLLF